MESEIRETRTHPHRTVTDCPSVKEMYIVVEIPNGTAMIAKDLILELALARKES